MFDDRFMIDSPGGCLMERRFRNVIVTTFRPPGENRQLDCKCVKNIVLKIFVVL